VGTVTISRALLLAVGALALSSLAPPVDRGATEIVATLTVDAGMSERRGTLTVRAYPYQGFGFRATVAWDDETATTRTSAGKDKSNGNATRARWCDVRGVSALRYRMVVYDGTTDPATAERYWEDFAHPPTVTPQ
jgi:hypothetical protein